MTTTRMMMMMISRPLLHSRAGQVSWMKRSCYSIASSTSPLASTVSSEKMTLKKDNSHHRMHHHCQCFNKNSSIVNKNTFFMTIPFQQRYFSTSIDQYPYRHRIGIGGTSLTPSQSNDGSSSGSTNSSFDQKSMAQYASVIRTALKYNVTTFESGYHGEEQLAQAFSIAVESRTDEDDFTENNSEEEEVILTARFGYRNLQEESDVGTMNGDVPVETTSVELNAQEGSTNSDGGGNTRVIVAHNLTREYTRMALEKSPLVQLTRKIQNEKQKQQQSRTEEEKEISKLKLPNVHLLFMAHNPETQGAPPPTSNTQQQQPDLTSIRHNIKISLTQSFIELETAVKNGLISSYGVCSNGLALPTNHPLHLHWKDVLEATVEAVQTVYPEEEEKVASFSTFQLPGNLLELGGLKVSNEIQDFLTTEENEEDAKMKKHLPKKINIFMTRPLTYHADLGLGIIPHPYKFVDYQLHSKSPAEIMATDGTNNYQWTNETLENSSSSTTNSSSLPMYQSAYNSAMNHFDATHILEKQQASSESLSVEERETLEGCRLLQSMIHDLDVKVPDYKTISEYEFEVLNSIMPLLSDSFEELDEDSGSVLQTFFAAHASAVRQSVAHNTRALLQKGGGAEVNTSKYPNMIPSSSIIKQPPYDIPNNVTLQEYALQFMLQKKENVVTKVIVGCPDANHVLEAVRAADRLVLDEEEEKKEKEEQ